MGRRRPRCAIPCRSSAVRYTRHGQGAVKPFATVGRVRARLRGSCNWIEEPMRELLRSNDAVLINYAQSLLRQAGIASFLADQHTSAAEGSIGAFPRRLMVGAEDWG